MNLTCFPDCTGLCLELRGERTGRLTRESGWVFGSEPAEKREYEKGEHRSDISRRICTRTELVLSMCTSEKLSPPRSFRRAHRVSLLVTLASRLIPQLCGLAQRWKQTRDCLYTVAVSGPTLRCRDERRHEIEIPKPRRAPTRLVRVYRRHMQNRTGSGSQPPAMPPCRYSASLASERSTSTIPLVKAA